MTFLSTFNGNIHDLNSFSSIIELYTQKKEKRNLIWNTSSTHNKKEETSVHQAIKLKSWKEEGIWRISAKNATDIQKRKENEKIFKKKLKSKKISLSLIGFHTNIKDVVCVSGLINWIGDFFNSYFKTKKKTSIIWELSLKFRDCVSILMETLLGSWEQDWNAIPKF